MTQNTVLFSFPENEDLGKILVQKTGFEFGKLTIREFPDRESFVQIFTEVKNKNIIILCGLDKPNSKIMPLIFLADLCRELGAKKITLVTPYLGYMRQDKRFNDGEAITSRTFAGILNNYFDSGVTIDPHLHRYHSLSQIYKIPFKTLRASDTVAQWIKENIVNPVLIGPDEESEQWVSDIGTKADIPFMILKKIRRGDKDVEISIPDIEKYKKCVPVLVDDIISTARTMIGTVKHLNKTGMNKTVCVGIHAVFAGDGYDALKNSGVADIVTCNTIPHITNRIDISEIIVNELR
jgi:ribose-phosphate pyrophosphokinase